jgi:chromosomal replication initiation ATPase DnaA
MSKRHKKNPPEIRVGLAKAVAAHAYGIDVETLRRPGCGVRHVSRARQVAMYLAHSVLHVGAVAVARSFGRTHGTVTHACQQIEAAREDPAFNRTIDWLETLVRRATEVPS